MTPMEALQICRLAKTLSPAQAVDEYTPEAWALVLRDVRFKDAEEALAALGAEQEWIHVSHIVKRVKATRADRVKRYFANVQPPSGLGDAEYSEWQRRTIEAIADGDLTPEPPSRIEGRRDVIRELGQAQSVDDALKAQPVRAQLAEAKRRLQEAEAAKKRAEDTRRAARTDRARVVRETEMDEESA